MHLNFIFVALPAVTLYLISVTTNCFHMGIILLTVIFKWFIYHTKIYTVCHNILHGRRSPSMFDYISTEQLF